MKNDKNTHIIFNTTGIVLNVGKVPHRKGTCLYTDRLREIYPLAYFTTDHAAEKFIELVGQILSGEIARAVNEACRDQAETIKRKRADNLSLSAKLADQVELKKKIKELKKENRDLRCDAYGLNLVCQFAKEVLTGKDGE